MSLISRYRLRFLLAWLALDASVRAQAASRQTPSVVGMLGQARAMQRLLHPWLVALLTRRERLAWTLHPPRQPDGLAAQVQEDVHLEPFDRWELWRWRRAWLQYLLEAELARLVRLLEAPSLLLSRPGWDRWEVTRWSLVTCLARISQLSRALEPQQRSASAQAALQAALEVVWRQLTAVDGQGIAS